MVRARRSRAAKSIQAELERRARLLHDGYADGWEEAYSEKLWDIARGALADHNEVELLRRIFGLAYAAQWVCDMEIEAGEAIVERCAGIEHGPHCPALRRGECRCGAEHRLKQLRSVSCRRREHAVTCSVLGGGKCWCGVSDWIERYEATQRRLPATPKGAEFVHRSLLE